MADTLFYACVAVAIWIMAPQIWRENSILLGTLLALEAVRFIFDFTKFGKPASYHSYLAKTWGLVMALAVITLFARGRSNMLLPLSLILGIACNVEGLMMSFILPAWRRDVKTLKAAWQFRAQTPKTGYSTNRRRSYARFTPIALSMLLIARSGFAVEKSEAIYLGGTGPLAQQSLGTLDSTSSSELIFRLKTSAAILIIPYQQMTCYQYDTEVTYHIGILPAFAVSLVKRRERQHFITLHYHDDAKTQQVVVLEVSKEMPRILLTILQTKVSKTCGGVNAERYPRDAFTGKSR